MDYDQSGIGPQKKREYDIWFAHDSSLEEAVSSEPVSERPNSLFFRENTGNFIVCGPWNEDPKSKRQSESTLMYKFPTYRNRELIWTDQGINSRYQGRSQPHQGKRQSNSFPWGKRGMARSSIGSNKQVALRVVLSINGFRALGR
jgi:hypothetical protein